MTLGHFLNKCTYLPAEDRTILAKAARIVSRGVSNKQSPHFNAFYQHHSLKLTLETRTETSIIKASVARGIDVSTVKTSQQALTIYFYLFRPKKQMNLHQSLLMVRPTSCYHDMTDKLLSL